MWAVGLSKYRQVHPVTLESFTEVPLAHHPVTVNLWVCSEVHITLPSLSQGIIYMSSHGIRDMRADLHL